jgi:hypothetical protein
MGMLRTWPYARPSLERTVVDPNLPVDQFFHVYVNSTADERIVLGDLLSLPRRAVYVERWGPQVVAAMQRDVPRTSICPRVHECAAATENPKTRIARSMLSRFRKCRLCWRALEEYVARHRDGVAYEVVMVTRLDLVYPPQPFDLGLVAAQLRQPRGRALFVPAGADMPMNDQVAIGDFESVRQYMDVYSHFVNSSIPLQADAVNNAMRSWYARLTIRRFWWQYWILRMNNVEYFQKYNASFYRSWFSISCWQKLNWQVPSSGLAHFANLNTTCTCDPSRLKARGGHVTAAQLSRVCNYEHGEYCDMAYWGGDGQGRRVCGMQGPPPGEPPIPPAESRGWRPHTKLGRGPS